MNSNQWRSELDACISRLDTQSDLTQVALDAKGGISKTRVRALNDAVTKTIVAYYRMVNAEKREYEPAFDNNGNEANTQ